MDNWGWQHKKILNSPLLTDTANLQLHMKYIPQRSPEDYRSSISITEDKRAALREAGKSEITISAKAPSQARLPTFRRDLKNTELFPADQGFCLPHQAPQPLCPVPERWAPKIMALNHNRVHPEPQNCKEQRMDFRFTYKLTPQPRAKKKPSEKPLDCMWRKPPY